MFLSIPFVKGDNCDNEHTKGEKLRPCNHCNHPLAFVWGCQKFTPERGNRLPWHGSAINRISHISSIVNTSAGICRCGGSWQLMRPALKRAHSQLRWSSVVVICAGCSRLRPPAPALPFAVSLTCARPRFCHGPPSVPKPRG